MASRSSDTTLSSSGSMREFPDAKSPYGHVTHGLRKIVPAEMACKMGCKGSKCKYDNSNWPPEKMVIPGLFSNWITEDIVAMARPRTELINDHNLVHNIKKVEIRSIFNLQSRGEHKDCGQGLDKESGYSYNPIDFTSAGIYYYNYELEDYNVSSCRNMIDMVKVFCFALQEGKVAVHCHAGLGRTGFFIACYLIYTFRMSANEAIFLIREKRPNSVQMLGQINAIKEFENYMKPLWVVYSHNFYSNQNEQTKDIYFDLRTFLRRQKLLIHGHESKKLKYIPKIIFTCGEQLRKLIINWNSDGIESNKRKSKSKLSNKQADDEILEKSSKRRRESSDDKPNIVITSALISQDTLSESMTRRLEYYQKEINETNDGYDVIKNESDPIITAALLWSWLDHLKEPVLKDQEINILLKNIPSSDSVSPREYRKELTYLNWDDLDNGTICTINYLTGLFHELLPIPTDLEKKLIYKLINSLTQTVQTTQDDNEYESLYISKKRLESNKLSILHLALSELIHKPMNPSKSLLEKSHSKKPVNKDYDYSEEVLGEESRQLKETHQLRNRPKRNDSR